MNNTFSLSAKVYRALLISSAFGAGILILPRFLCQCTHQDAWLTSALSGLVLILSAFLTGICPRITEISNIPVKTVFSVLLCLYYLFTAALSLSLLCKIVNAYLLTKTPVLVISLCFCLLICYAVAGGLRLVSRFAELTQIILPISILLLVPTLLFISITDFEPALCISAGSHLYGISRCVFPFAFSTLPMILPPPQNQSRVRISVLAAFTVSGLFVVITALCVGLFGEKMCQHFLYPVIMLYKAIPVPIIDRLDLFFLILWLILSVRPCMSFTLASIISFKNMEEKLSQKQGILSVIFCIILFSVSVFIILTNCSVLMSRILGGCYFFLGIITPFFLWLLYRKGKKCGCSEEC